MSALSERLSTQQLDALARVFAAMRERQRQVDTARNTEAPTVVSETHASGEVIHSDPRRTA